MEISIHHATERGDIITVLAEFRIVWRGRLITVPAGFESDGVSTPEFRGSSISPAIDPRTLRAGIAHDLIYRTQPAGWTRAEADRMFYDLCRADGLSWWRAQKAWWGLRCFGGGAWRENQSK